MPVIEAFVRLCRARIADQFPAALINIAGLLPNSASTYTMVRNRRLTVFAGERRSPAVMQIFACQRCKHPGKNAELKFQLH
ncbi:hypothetical protein [Mesorhizobium sp. M0040]|uniref:hypothetical protein n=1 Tax=Mesorhizobium sp. M0040 TaxID=2956855 RepID=UPI0033364BBA